MFKFGTQTAPRTQLAIVNALSLELLIGLLAAELLITP